MPAINIKYNKAKSYSRIWRRSKAETHFFWSTGKGPSTCTKNSCSGLTELSCKQTPSLTSRSDAFETPYSQMSNTRIHGPRGQPGSRICAFLVSTVRVRGTYVGDAFKALTLIFFPVIRAFEFTGDGCSITTIVINQSQSVYYSYENRHDIIYLFVYNLHSKTIDHNLYYNVYIT